MKNGYSICFNEWALDKTIKGELGLLLIISSLTAEKGYCYATNNYFAELFGIDEVSISRKIKKLEGKGYIKISYTKRGCEVVSREIRLTKMLIVGLQKCQSSVNKNVKENIINNNIINNNNTPPISPPVGGDDSQIKNQDEDKIKNLCPVSVPSGWKDIEMPKDEIIIPLELREAMDLWLKYRKEIKKPYKPMGLRECVKKLEKLSGNDRAVAVAIVRESISNGWTGLFPLKKKLDMKGKDEYKSIVDMMEKFIEGEEGC